MADTGATSDQSRQDFAERRTHLAQQRTLLAKQRTFSAWIRTGLATIAAGLGGAQLLGDAQPQWLVVLVAALLALTGAGILVVAFWSYRRVMRDLAEERAWGIPVPVIGIITATLVLSAVAAFVIIVTN